MMSDPEKEYQDLRYAHIQVPQSSQPKETPKRGTECLLTEDRRRSVLIENPEKQHGFREEEYTCGLSNLISGENGE